MGKEYLAKIIAKDAQGLQLISACCSKSIVKAGQIKYLKKNKIFLISLERFKREKHNNTEKVNSICKFEFVDSVKSKNIYQNNNDEIFELLGIDLFKQDKHFKITLLFKDNFSVFSPIIKQLAFS